MTPPTPAQLIAEARIWTAQQPHNVEEDPYATHLVRQLADALTAALQQAEELQRAVTQSAREIRRPEKRIVELEAPPAELHLCQQCGVTLPCFAHPRQDDPLGDW